MPEFTKRRNEVNVDLTKLTASPKNSVQRIAQRFSAIYGRGSSIILISLQIEKLKQFSPNAALTNNNFLTISSRRTVRSTKVVKSMHQENES